MWVERVASAKNSMSHRKRSMRRLDTVWNGYQGLFSSDRGTIIHYCVSMNVDLLLDSLNSSTSSA